MTRRTLKKKPLVEALVEVKWYPLNKEGRAV